MSSLQPGRRARAPESTVVAVRSRSSSGRRSTIRPTSPCIPTRCRSASWPASPRASTPPGIGTEYVLMALPIPKGGRKQLAGVALMDGQSQVLAVAEARSIEAKTG